MDIRKIDSVSQLLQVRQEAAQAGKSLVYLGDRQVRVVDRGQISKAVIEATGQNDREVRRLNEFAASLRRSETGVPPGPELTLEQRAERLMGRTRSPRSPPTSLVPRSAKDRRRSASNSALAWTTRAPSPACPRTSASWSCSIWSGV